jgi:hypothetical protein
LFARFLLGLPCKNIVHGLGVKAFEAFRWTYFRNHCPADPFDFGAYDCIDAVDLFAQVFAIRRHIGSAPNVPRLWIACEVVVFLALLRPRENGFANLLVLGQNTPRPPQRLIVGPGLEDRKPETVLQQREIRCRGPVLRLILRPRGRAVWTSAAASRYLFIGRSPYPASSGVCPRLTIPASLLISRAPSCLPGAAPAVQALA